MAKITVGVLTVSDRCASNVAVDESGPNLVEMIKNGVIRNAEVSKTGLVPDEKEKIQEVLKDWISSGVKVILTTGGTGVGTRDVTPDATMALIEKQVPGISLLMFKKSSDITPLAALSRGVCGVRERSLIINLPGSKKASKECLDAVAVVIPHAVDLVNGLERQVASVHSSMTKRKSKVSASSPANRARASPYPCLRVSEAQEIVLNRVNILQKSTVKQWDEALGFVLAQDVVAKDNLPPFNASLKDGYAVKSSDKSYLKKVVGFANAGSSRAWNVRLEDEQCFRVSTGAAIPANADAVVQVEDTTVETHNDDKTEEKEIRFKKFPCSGTDVRPKGSDFCLGKILLLMGTYLDSSAVGVLAAAGVTSVSVFEKPLVGIFSTGDELVNPGVQLPPGKVRDSNRVTLGNLLKEEGFPSSDFGIVPDDPDSLCDALARGFAAADIIVTTGGMSMGERDFLKEVLVSDFDADICFGRVWMKPGKPTAFAILEFEGKPKLWFGLPGNPASAFVATHLFLLPALRRISKQKKDLPESVTAKTKCTVKWDERVQYLRGVLEYTRDGWMANFHEEQSSSQIASCVSSNCLFVIPANTGYYYGKKLPEAFKALIIGKIF